MADTIERTYNIPLRSEWLKTQKYRRAKRAVATVRAFLEKHMKSNEILLGRQLNMEIWKHGIKNPPHHIKVAVKKDKEGVVKAELFGHTFEEKVEQVRKQKDEGLMDKLKGAASGKAPEAKAEPKDEKPKETAEEKAPAKAPAAEKPAQ